jgi:hypothetical protein
LPPRSASAAGAQHDLDEVVSAGPSCKKTQTGRAGSVLVAEQLLSNLLRAADSRDG